MNTSHFGTDGIRGIYGKDVTDETAYRLGAALAKRGKILLARDNRLSSPILASAFLGGVTAAGGRFSFLGLSTTPALYYAFTHSDAETAVMITASHNPPDHNGLKVFDKAGKLGNDACRALEEEMQSISLSSVSYRTEREDPSLLEGYRAFFREAVGRLDGLKVAFDYAGGAGYVFRDLLPSLGAEVFPLGLSEKGDAVNVGCGALFPGALREETLRVKADLGIALDGDGDRILVVTKEGDILDGDAILYLFARKMKREGSLAKDKVALTVMTNGGVLHSLTEIGVTPVLCNVGDSAVTAAMRSEGLSLGGEQSGHIVLGDLLMTGDGILVGGMLLKMLRAGEPVLLPKELTVYPQSRIDLRLPDKSVAYAEATQAFAAEVKARLPRGRVLVRASGTENVVRIMTECPDAALAEACAREIRDFLLSRNE
ncbi:MAG: hypothetical protein J6Y74_05490 [Clostridia bacterium]|nr:hypothetical protein [Clostridia bacterium]